jgi:CRISPR-associated protein Cas1
MAWRVVAIENPASLGVKDNKIVIKQDEEVSLPLEDIDSLILDSYGISLSANLLAELASRGIATTICDAKHLPCGVITPYSQHSRGAKIAKSQINMSEPLKKQLWTRIVRQKIENQAKVLQNLGLSESEELYKVSKELRSGDPTNRESVAARIYFDALLDDATRRKPMWHNSALNYGYAIVRSCLARSIAARGLVATQGVFHKSELNQFNLADDLIEPFRAAVDEYILKIATHHIGDEDSKLSAEDREQIIDIINQSVIINNKKWTIKHACDMVVESLSQAIQSGEAEKLILTQII